jgi:hypothetical protein
VCDAIEVEKSRWDVSRDVSRDVWRGGTGERLAVAIGKRSTGLSILGSRDLKHTLKSSPTLNASCHSSKALTALVGHGLSQPSFPSIVAVAGTIIDSSRLPHPGRIASNIYSISRIQAF